MRYPYSTIHVYKFIVVRILHTLRGLWSSIPDSVIFHDVLIVNPLCTFPYKYHIEYVTHGKHNTTTLTCVTSTVFTYYMHMQIVCPVH